MKVTSTTPPISKPETKPDTDNEKADSQFGKGIVRREKGGSLSRWEILDRADLLRKNGGALRFGQKSKPSDNLSFGKTVKVHAQEIPESNVGLNDPTDPVTVEKLKGILSNGGVNFSEKERSVLEKILK